jgi:hypothetical protein
MSRKRTRLLLKIICKNCKKTFSTYTKGRIFCSISCSTSYFNKIGKKGMKGRKHSKEQKEKWSKDRTGETNVSKRKDHDHAMDNQ